jgi:hypothetical protein
MTETNIKATKLHALLIGIDCYLPNRLSDNTTYVSLGGCVRDITHVEGFLKLRFNLPSEQIVKLTASKGAGDKPIEPPEQWPTYRNMVAAFKRVAQTAQPGDQVYIHYSGHGGRTPTIVPELKGPDAHDESLVPTDIGAQEGQYLRDIELARLFQTMVDKGLILTVVLDSCHSGGAVRGVEVAVRGSNTIDATPRPTESLVAPHHVLEETWRRLTSAEARNVQIGSGWLPEPKGYVLLAACRPNELAYEYAFDGAERNGALTYWLLKALQGLRPGLSYKTVYDSVLAKVHSQFEQQTPLLQGEGDRAVFGSDRLEQHYAVPVLAVDEANQHVQLLTGQAQLIRKGAQFAIYPPGTTSFDQVTQRQAVVEIDELGASQSGAKILGRFGDAPIEQGAPAVLLGAAALNLVRKVYLAPTEHGDLAAVRAALQELHDASGGRPWVELAADGESAQYQVSINAKAEYEIADRTGAPYINMRPALRIVDADAAAGVVRRLVHLAKYHATQQLSNEESSWSLKDKLEVKLLGVQQDYDPVDKPAPQPFTTAENIIAAGAWTFLSIKNHTPAILNITVLDLQPDWGITQIHPFGAGDLFDTLDPGQERTIPLQTSLPNGVAIGRDILKVFATAGAADFHWLELPALDQPQDRSGSVKGVGDPLDDLLAAIGAEQPPTRTVAPAVYPSREWTTIQKELEIRTA